MQQLIDQSMTEWSINNLHMIQPLKDQSIT